MPRRFGALPISASVPWQAARKRLAVEFFLARDFDMQFGRQGVYHGRANTVQATRCGIGLAGKFAPCMQRCQDHLNRRFAGEFPMSTLPACPAIIADGQPVYGLQIDVDAVGMAPATASSIELSRISAARWCRARAFIRTANIHAWQPDELQPSSTSIFEASYPSAFAAAPNRSAITHPFSR